MKNIYFNKNSYHRRLQAEQFCLPFMPFSLFSIRHNATSHITSMFWVPINFKFTKLKDVSRIDLLGK